MDGHYEWIQTLVNTEEETERSGFIDYESNLDSDRAKISAALLMLAQLRNGFNEAIELFNDHKLTPNSKIKLYGIAKTHADFMLFRRGFKLVFSLKQPGVISVRTHFVNPTLPPVTSMNYLNQPNYENLISHQFKGEEDLLVLTWGAFQEEIWTYKGQPMKVEFAIKHYLMKFAKESASPGL